MARSSSVIVIPCNQDPVQSAPISGCQAVDEPSQLIELHSRPHSPPAPAPIATPEIRNPPGSADGRTPRGMDGRNALRRMGSGSALRLEGPVLVQADLFQVGAKRCPGLGHLFPTAWTEGPRVPAGVGRAASAPRISPPSIDAAANGLDTNTELCGNGSQAPPASQASGMRPLRAAWTGR